MTRKKRDINTYHRKHGHTTAKGSKKRIYWIWASIKQRCTNPNNKQYHNYGGRGILLCDRWMSFENFLQDMGEKPAGMSIERKDNSKGYDKNNCIWADTFAQARNRRSVIWLNGETCKDASLRLGSKINIVSRRLKRGWDKEKAFTVPVLTNGINYKKHVLKGDTRTI